VTKGPPCKCSEAGGTWKQTWHGHLT